MKAIGTGLSLQLNRLEFHHSSWDNISLRVDGIESKDWNFFLFDLDEKHLVTSLYFSTVSLSYPKIISCIESTFMVFLRCLSTSGSLMIWL